MDPLPPLAYPGAYGMPPLWDHGAHSYVHPSYYEMDDDSGYASEDVDFHRDFDEVSDDVNDYAHAGHRSWDERRCTTSPPELDHYWHRPLPSQARVRSGLHDWRCTCGICSNKPRSYFERPTRRRGSRHGHPRPARETTRFDAPTTARARRSRRRRNAISEPSTHSTVHHLDSDDHGARIPPALPAFGERFEEVEEEDEDEDEGEEVEERGEDDTEEQEESKTISSTPPPTPTQIRRQQSINDQHLPLDCRRVSAANPARSRVHSLVYGLPREKWGRPWSECRWPELVGAWQELRRRRARLERKLGRVEERERMLRSLEGEGEWEE